MENIVHTLEDLDNLKRGEQPTIQCSCCGKIFKRKYGTVWISLKRGNINFYCSKECQIKFKTGKALKSNKRVVHNINCKNCGKPIVRTNGNLKKVKNSFCNSSCAAKFNNAIKKILREPKLKIAKIIKKRNSRKPRFFCLCSCFQCGKEVLRTKRDLTVRNKNKEVFCSKSCRMTYQNLNTKKKYSCRRSKAEEYLCGLIENDFKELEILRNDRSVLPSKLEIDIYIPKIRLAIELNGPTHYLPIYGAEKLNRVIKNDERKNIEMVELKIDILTIDISSLTSSKKTKEFLDKLYSEKIREIIENLAGD